MQSPVATFALFQIVWLCCAIGAAHDRSLPGILAAVIAVALNLSTASSWRRAAMIALAAGTIGLCAESLLIVGGYVRYAAPWPTHALAPAWIVALWLAFANTLENTQRMLGSHPFVKSSLLGLALAPLSYLAGQRLGALELSKPVASSCVAVALVWGAAYPALLALERRLASPS